MQFVCLSGILACGEWKANASKLHDCSRGLLQRGQEPTMETLKRIEDIQTPDERNLYWVFLSTGKQVSIEDHYADIASISVNTCAPEDVRSYFVTLQNLCVYAWFSYGLYALVVFLSYTLIEMALT